MQLRSPEVTRVNFHLSQTEQGTPRQLVTVDQIRAEHISGALPCDHKHLHLFIKQVLFI